MRKQYILTEEEVNRVRDRMSELRKIALMSRDARDAESNREFYLRAKGFEDCMKMLGIIRLE